MSEPVTWLLPIKNGMPYLPETLASIEAQTYKNWQVLVWDNGSTDGTLEELKKWIPNRLLGRIVTGEPHGLGASLARMVEECKTELCARIDADDINLPNRLEEQVAFLALHPEVAVLGSQMYFINHQGKVSNNLHPLPLYHDDIVNTMLVNNCMAHPSVIFRRSAILEIGNYHDLFLDEDFDLWMRVATKFKLANLDKPLIRYRIHGRSATQIATQKRMIKITNNCISRNAPALFGCESSDIELLQNRIHPRTIKTLYKIVQHLHRTQGGDFIDRLCSDSFIQAAKSLAPRTDIISRLAIVSLKLYSWISN